jgi:hypothetical protein
MLWNNRNGLETIPGKIYYLHISASLSIKTVRVSKVPLLKTIKLYGGVEVQLHPFLTVLVGDKWSSYSCCFIREGGAPCARSVGHWAAHRARTDALDEKQERQCQYNVTLRCVRATIVAVEEQ